MLQSSCDGGSCLDRDGLLEAALLGSFGGFFYLGTRIDAFGARLDSWMDGLNDRLDAQSARIDAQGGRIDAQYATIQTQGRDLAAAIQAQSDRIDAQYATIQAQGRDLTPAILAQGRELTAATMAQGAELAAQTIAAGIRRRGTGYLVDASASRAYAEWPSRPASSWRRHLGDYLRLSVEHLDPSDEEQAKGLAARQRRLRSIV